MEIKDLLRRKSDLKNEIKQLKDEIKNCSGGDSQRYVLSLEEGMEDLKDEKITIKQDIFQLCSEIIEVWNRLKSKKIYFLK